MLEKLRRAAVVLLLAVVCATAGLYLLANLETAAQFARGLVSPVVMAMQGGEDEPGAQTTAPAATLPPEHEPPPVIAAFEPTEPAELPDELPVEARAEPPDFGSLPVFLHKDMLNMVPDEVERVIYILGKGTHANLWLVERADGVWRTAAGPLACRIGDGGLRRDKSEGDLATPIGWFIPSYLYTGGGARAAWPTRAVAEGDVWVTDPASAAFNTVAAPDSAFSGNIALEPGGVFLDLGYNRNRDPGRGGGVFLYGAASLDAPTAGAVALSASDMERVARWLDVEKYTAVGIFRAETAAWQVEAGMPEGFSFLPDAVPGAREDARYAGYDNFLGRPLDGYLGAHVVVSDAMAAALRKAQAKLEQSGLGLLVYDSYRPQRAVDDIFRWLEDDDPGNKENYFPELEKAALAGRYLAEYSLHRRAAAVDLTICDLQTGEPLDMGTGFDFFSARSAYGAKGLTAVQTANRGLLRAVMRECGFSAYDGEWWHFNLTGVAAQGAVYDFVIPQ